VKARQGMRVYVHVPRTPVAIAAGLLDLNGREVVLVRRSTVASRCWLVDPPLCTTFRQGAQDPDGRQLLPGHQQQLAALPESWMTCRAPTWSAKDLAYLRAHYGHEPTAAIAAQLGRGLAATRSKVEDLHLRCRTVWTPELDEFLTLLFPDTAATALAEVLGATAAAVRQRAMTLGVKKDPGFAAACTRAILLARSRFTPEISEIIELLYADTRGQDVADLVGMPLMSVQRFARKHGIKKTPECIREMARIRALDPDGPIRRSGFQKGHVPANKGVKGINYPGMQATQFKKGQRTGAANINWKPIGAYSVNDDGYLVQKVQDGGYIHDVWRPVHHLVWIAANGPIPKGHVVRFKDGRKSTNPDEITADAVECITKAENARRNAWHANMPPELRKLMGTRIALTRTINKRSREMEEQHG
jgi:hypothetical protein